MNMLPVQSHNIAFAGYDSAKHILRVQFHSGDIYEYFDVPEYLFEQLMNAPSPGSFLNQFIKDHFRYNRIR